MSDGQRRAVEEYYPLYGLTFPPLPNWEELFPTCSRRVVEIGFGNGEATIEIAQNHPETAFIGIEVHTPGIGQLLREIHRRSLVNLKVLRHDAVEFVKALPRESLDGYHVFFPDPWPKKRHHKRRLLQRPFLAEMIASLKPGGILYVATDWEEYAEEILNTLGTFAEMQNPFPGWAEGLSWRPRTKFEKRGRQENRPIREILFEKRGAS